MTPPGTAASQSLLLIAAALLAAPSASTGRGGDGGAALAKAAAGPPECAAALAIFGPSIWEDFRPVAEQGPITAERVKELAEAASRWFGSSLYFAEVAIIAGRVLYRTFRRPDEGRYLGTWLDATLKLIATAAAGHGEWIPDVRFVVSVLDEPFLEKGRQGPLPLLSSMTSRAHWDIPVPAVAFFESDGGVSSANLKQAFQVWETEEWQRDLAKRFPWAERRQRGFFRGHDWQSRNTFLEALPSRPREACVHRSNVEVGFAYRRWYAEQSLAGAPLEDDLDVRLTGSHAFARPPGAEPLYGAPVALPDHAAHKYLLHLDGSTASNRFIKLLMLGSVVLKQDSVFEEYFYRHLRPFEHYVPLARDRCETTNLTSSLAWLREHDLEAQAIAQAGQSFARQYLSTSAATCYWQRVLAAYASLQDFEPSRSTDFAEFEEYLL